MWGVGRDLERWTTSCSPFTECSEQTVFFLPFLWASAIGIDRADVATPLSLIAQAIFTCTTSKTHRCPITRNVIRGRTTEDKGRWYTTLQFECHAKKCAMLNHFRITFPQRILTHSDVSRYTFSGSERTLNESIQNVHFEGAHVVPRILLFSFTTWLCVRRVE